MAITEQTLEHSEAASPVESLRAALRTGNSMCVLRNSKESSAEKRR